MDEEISLKESNFNAKSNESEAADPLNSTNKRPKEYNPLLETVTDSDIKDSFSHPLISPTGETSNASDIYTDNTESPIVNQAESKQNYQPTRAVYYSNVNVSKDRQQHKAVVVSYESNKDAKTLWKNKPSNVTVTSLRKKGRLRLITENKLLNRLILGRGKHVAVPWYTVNENGEVVGAPLQKMPHDADVTFYADDESVKTEQVTKYSSNVRLNDNGALEQGDSVDVAEDSDLIADEDSVPEFFIAPASPSQGHVISKRTYRRTDWLKRHIVLNIYRCTYPITRRHMESSSETLTTLRCHSLLSFRSLLAILQTCTKLQSLRFTNIVLIDKKHSESMSTDEKTIDLPLLNTLKFIELNRRFTKYDYWLLQIFADIVHTPQLSAFVFRAADFFPKDPRMKITHIEVRKFDPSIILKFLTKNRESLTKISIGGLGFELFQHNKTIACFPEISLIKLQSISFSLNIQSIEDLLVHQDELKELKCLGFTKNFDEIVRIAIAISIQDSCNTIRSIIICPTIVTKLNRRHHLKMLTWSCEIFRRCKVLEKLCIDIRIASRIDGKKLSCCMITTLNLLPHTLVILELYQERFTGDELDSFFRQIEKYQKLKRIVFGTASGYEYLLYVNWIEDLINLPALVQAEFHGGKLSDFKAACKFMLSKPKGFVTMTIFTDKVSFRKTEVHNTDGGSVGSNEVDQ